MADPNPNTPTAGDADKAAKSLTKAAAAKAVRRPVVKTEKDGSQTTTYVAVKEDEVLAFRDYGDHVTVVTVDGQKFDSRDTPAKADAKA